MLTACPTPTGLGEATKYAYDGKFHGGECALAAGIANSVKAIVDIRIILIAVADFWLKDFILFSPLFF